MLTSRGAYPADRAAALSGVPLSTVHYWAREGILEPSISARRVKLWSYADLMGLRIISWLRQPKSAPGGADVPRTTMQAVKRALSQLLELDLDLWSEETGPSVTVDRGGQILVLSKPDAEARDRQRVLTDEDHPEFLSVIDPFSAIEGSRGPDLHSPRPQLRIVPGKLGGSPHVLHTRLESQAVGALATAGLVTASIYELYPDVARSAIDDALDLEGQLAKNLHRVAA